MNLIYPAIFVKDGDAYDVSFPDLDGCFTCGDDINDAFFNAREALSGYTATVLENGLNLPAASDLASVDANGGTVLLVDAKPAFSKAAVKKTLSIPAWLNERAEEAHAPFSKLLQDALAQYLGLV